MALGEAGAEPAKRLAGLAAAIVVSRMLLTVLRARGTFGAFSEAMDLGAGLVFGLAALALTGGVRSELYVCLLVDLVLVRGYLGVGAARFLTAAIFTGLAALELGLASLGGAPWITPLPAALRLFWPVALTIATDPVWWPRSKEERVAQPRGEAARRVPAPAAGAEAPGRTVREFRQLLHDLRSPVTVIRLYADLISEAARKGTRLPEEPLKNLSNEIGHLESLLDPKAVAAGRSGRAPRRERLNLVTLLGSLANTYNLAHSDRLRIEFMADSADIPVVGDALALQRAVRNVLDNAVKYTPGGGHVRIRASASGGTAVVSIADTGPGMSPAEQKRVLEGGYRGAVAQASGEQGMGVGLSVTRELLEANGGSVTLVSQPGRGSDVRIRLPLA